MRCLRIAARGLVGLSIEIDKARCSKLSLEHTPPTQ